MPLYHVTYHYEGVINAPSINDAWEEAMEFVVTDDQGPGDGDVLKLAPDHPLAKEWLAGEGEGLAWDDVVDEEEE